MENSNLKKLVHDLIDKKKWSDFLRKFTDVLRVNIFVIDYSGQMLIFPYLDGGRKRYGSNFLSTTFKNDFSKKIEDPLKNFVQQGGYYEIKDPFDFRLFAIPVNIIEGEQKTILYLMVGPIILNKRWNQDDYLNMAEKIGLKREGLIDSINEIRVVSFITVKAILDLLSELAKDIVELSFEKQKLCKTRFNKELLPKKITEVAQDLYATIHLDELLVTILDVALNLTQAECGSIMFIDENNELTIKVSRGIKEENIQNTRLKIGEGIAGIAAQENTSFIISGKQGDNRIRHLLNRPSIKKSAVIPLARGKKVFGVLNVHTEKDIGRIEENVENLKYLSKLISAAIHSI